MKRVLLIGMAILFLAGTANADLILFEDFEDSNVSYTTSVPEFTDGSGNFFIRTDGSDYGSFVSYSNIQGTSYFAAMDIDGEGATLPVTMTFAGINISGYADLSFSSMFAEDDDGSNEDWDQLDYVKVEYQIDNGGYQNLLAFENDGSTYNTQAFQDSNFDGTGDGVALTDVFSLFSADISGTGDLLDVRFTFQLDAGDEDIAIDNVQVNGVSAVPVPAALWLMITGILGFVGYKRKKN